jgi:hypothetical protein
MEFIKFKNLLLLIKYIFQLLFIAVLVYQVSEVTNSYFNFPIEVNLIVIKNNTIDMPSVTFCLKRSVFWRNDYSKQNNYTSDDINVFGENIDFYERSRNFSETLFYNNFGQLFNISVNLTSLIQCSSKLNYENKVISFDNCKDFGEVKEFISGKLEYGKCFTFFNINDRYNKIIDYKMDKSSYIEFKFEHKKFVNFYFSAKYYDLDLIYLSIHSTKSIFSKNNFHPLKINFKNNDHLLYKFSRSYVQYLEWPYQTNCIHSKTVNGLIHTFEDCMNSCILNNLLKVNSCLHSNNSLNVGILLNSVTEKIKFCNKNIDNMELINNLTLKCLKTFRQNCILEYINSNPEKSGFYESVRSKRPKSFILRKNLIIRSANIPIYEYTMYPKFLLIDYASNLGALISLWFGVAVNDVYIIIQPVLNLVLYLISKISLILQLEYILRYLLSERCLSFIRSIKILISTLYLKLRKIKFKYLLQFICIVGFFYQTIDLTLEYLHYKIEVGIEIKRYANLPAVSLCERKNSEYKKLHYLRYSNIPLRFKNFFSNCNDRGRCVTNSSFYFDLINNQTFFSDYLELIDAQYDLPCQIETLNCHDVFVKSYNQYSKCYTFYSGLSYNSYVSSSLSRKIVVKIHYPNSSIYIHDSNTLPSYSTSKLPPIRVKEITKTRISYNKVHFERLPPPYESNCQNYSGKIKSRDQCINELIYDFILENGCLPRNHQLLTYVVIDYNYSKFNYSLCVNETKTVELKLFEGYCRESCIEDLYEFYELSDGNFHGYYVLETTNSQYLSFIYSPKMEFMQFIVNFGGLIGLWQGISLNDLKDIIFQSIRRVLSTSRVKRQLNKFTPLSRRLISIFRNSKFKVNLIKKYHEL